MPLAKIHVVEGRYDETRIAKVSGAIQAALMNTLRVPPEDLFGLRAQRDASIRPLRISAEGKSYVLPPVNVRRWRSR
jgi:hypothetical protein